MKDIVIASFYKFIALDDFEIMRDPLLMKMREINVKGTVILAKEGINGSIAGKREEIELLYQFIQAFEGLDDLIFKETFDENIPFDKAKVKLRKETVTMGHTEVDPTQSQGAYLGPEEWHELIQDPEVVIIDTRNNYEYQLGTFKNAINPNTNNFRDFPQFMEAHLQNKKQKIAMFCTGGIRCEKSTAYLKDQGFEEVYQLHDGILNYLQSIPENNSLWEGVCFVFDDRVAVNHQLERVLPQLPQEYKDEYYSK